MPSPLKRKNTLINRRAKTRNGIDPAPENVEASEAVIAVIAVTSAVITRIVVAEDV